MLKNPLWTNDDEHWLKCDADNDVVDSSCGTEFDSADHDSLLSKKRTDRKIWANATDEEKRRLTDQVYKSDCGNADAHHNVSMLIMNIEDRCGMPLTDY